MFDKKSHYAQNKRDKNAIVYTSPTGEPVLLTRDDFASKEEFQSWKDWSDSEYKTSEKNGRSFYDNCIPLDERLDCIGAVESIEDAYFDKLDEPQRIHARQLLSQQIRDALTDKQYRRLWLYYVDGLSERAIAEKEQVGQQRISKSILTGKRIIENILEKSSD